MESLNPEELLLEKAEETFSSAQSAHELERARIDFLGEKSHLKALQKNITNLPASERASFGKKLNDLRQQITKAFDRAKDRVIQLELAQKINQEKLDITLPGISSNFQGSLHPLTLITKEIIDIFKQMGFELIDSPEVETEYHNFTALNTPAQHPARDEQDTFYTNVADHVILRSHVSPFQARVLEQQQPPIRCISHGRVYRNEEINPRKLPFFHQFEILCVEEGINFSHLKWTLLNFYKGFFGDDIEIRIRPDFFPFTEPSAEIDALCTFCKGKGCSTCGYKGWLELLGCGMVDPNVLEMAGIDPDRYSGFAAGLGLERFAMLKYGVSDIRDFFAGDVRFLQQFATIS